MSRFYYNDSNKDLREINSNISLNEGIELYKIIKKYFYNLMITISNNMGGLSNRIKSWVSVIRMDFNNYTNTWQHQIVGGFHAQSFLI